MADPEFQLKRLRKICTYLNHEAVEIEGVKIFGSPFVISTKLMGFGYLPENGDKIWKDMPEKIDVLVTHGPPFGIRDASIHTNQNCGCKVMLEKVEQIKPKVHIFGHIHEGNGHSKIGETDFYNVAFMDEKYHPKNKPVVIEIEVDQK